MHIKNIIINFVLSFIYLKKLNKLVYKMTEIYSGCGNPTTLIELFNVNKDVKEEDLKKNVNFIKYFPTVLLLGTAIMVLYFFINKKNKIEN